ncbi:4-oxalocrotonate tautomerase [Mycobacterium sp. CBMA271]|uniref:tautomerase family protein n=1 Tax=unclassified Mycobacteroides TaxID=2618759 RepID=UPI0012DFCEC1|nr:MULTISPECIES: tautomerase family protein [unclassified Mycobacteroides]MUM19045.1 4-oxalocrotonate tautomerase [Mycobacteroides sp. CBMA 326]MUM21458.1 4-oxalocrotonate tautomerase [Mycobacteroides sp. CBMA 271]
MPLWNIYHTPDVFSDNEKSELSRSITDIYTAAGLPRFYVVTLFTEVRPGNFYVGGEQTTAGVRIHVDHIARTLPDKSSRERVTARIGQVLAPYLTKDGLHWEFHIDETSEELWMINGQVPPPMNSDAEREWARTNSSGPYLASA